jgi:two-component sensor histidine kinase
MGRAAPVTKSVSESGSADLLTRVPGARGKKQFSALAEKWRAALAREEVLRRENGELLQRHRSRLQEFEHRLLNGLQMVSGLLVRQSIAATPAAAQELNVAAARIYAFGSVHRRLRFGEYKDTVDIKRHLQDLCDDLTGLLFPAGVGQSIVVEAPNYEIPATLAVPLSLIVNELITNSAKHAKTDITVRFESTTPVRHSVSVLDDGPGLPGEFDPASSKGLGMQIVMALVKEIGGELRFSAGDKGRGTRVDLTFYLPVPGDKARPLDTKRGFSAP